MKNFIFTALTCLTVCSAFGAPTVAAYYESWWKPDANENAFTLKKLDPHLLSDLYLAFAAFDSDYNIHPIDFKDPEKLYPDLQALKARSDGSLKLFLSIGGAHFNDPQDPYGMGAKTYRLFSKMAADPIARKVFIDSAISYAEKYGFDGIDIDWEFPGVANLGGADVDFENLISLLQEFRNTLFNKSSSLLLSICLPATVPEGVWPLFRTHPQLFYRWAAVCAHFCDRITLMSYNYHTPLGSSIVTGANAPLHRDTLPTSTLFVAESVENYLKNGLEAAKILLGIPLYGWKYANVSSLSSNSAGPGKPFRGKVSTNPLISNAQIENVLQDPRWNSGFDPLTSTAYGFNLKESEWISFDTPETISLKAQYALKKGLKGVIFWAVNLESNALEGVQAAKGEFDGNN
ncbi:MAG: glycoside hydrolase family 18 protein [Chlamydiia bacterium]|nr:glycoside hydrolase family 18 protein [Chlamydiia bacterium]